MLDELFMQVLDLSKIGSIVILVVIAARFFLKKAPKIISYALWSVALFRLLCPVSLELPVSVMPEIVPIKDTYALTDVPVSVVEVGAAVSQAVEQAADSGTQIEFIPIPKPAADAEVEYVTVDWQDVGILVGQYVWLAGVSVMLIRSLIAYLKLRKRLEVKALLREHIYLVDDMDTPFVMGIFRPRIYLPSKLQEQEREYIIAHEQQHIKRLDPLWKALAFMALTLHWFNPLVWVAFILAGKDMEMSCDEAVIRKLGSAVRADYAASLVSLATGKRIIAGTPLAFGEGNTKSRVRNLAKWKKPAIGVIVVAVCLSLLLSACLLIDPAKTMPQITDPNKENGPSTAVQIPDGSVTDTPYAILFAVSDYQGQGLGKSTKNDVNILSVVNPTTKQVLLIDTPAVCYIPNPAGNGEMDTLELCGVAGVENSVQALSGFYKVPVRFYAHISRYGIQQLADLLGGIAVYSDTAYQAGDTWIQAGENQLTGTQVLDFGTEQRNMDNANHRIQILKGLLQKLGSADQIGACVSILNKLEYDLRSNLSEADIRALVEMQKSDNAPWTFTGFAVSGEWAVRKVYTDPNRDMRVCIPDPNTVDHAKKLMQQVVDGKKLTQIGETVQTRDPSDKERPQPLTKEEAISQGYVIRHAEQIEANGESWTEFLKKVQAGDPETVRFAVCNDDSVRYCYSIDYDGQTYTKKTTADAFEIAQTQYTERAYAYLLHFVTVQESETGTHRETRDLYYLSCESYDSLEALAAAQKEAAVSIPPVCVYEHLTVEKIGVLLASRVPEELSEAALELDGRKIALVKDAASLRAIRTLFANAEWLGYEPKTYSLGPELTLTGSDGTVWKAQICLEKDLLYVDGEFYDYGPGYNDEGARNAILHMLNLFGLHDWPYWMYEWYEDVGWDLAPPELFARYP